MKSSEFLNEGNDKTVADVKANHPEVYAFLRKIGEATAFEQRGEVQAYNTAGNHMIVIDIRPVGGVKDIKAKLDAAGVAYNAMTDFVNSGEVLEGSFNDIHWTVGHSGPPGNVGRRWRFAVPHKDDETQYYTDRTMEEVDEGDVVPGDFSAKGGEKPQTQNAKAISMAQAFGSNGYNILANAGIKLIEKPSYWSDLDRTAIGELGLARVRKLFKEAGVPLPDVEAWEVFPIEPNSTTYVKGPLATIENVPTKGVFIIRDLPYSDDRRNANIQYGDFLVDSQGADSYIRFWRKID